MMVTGLVAFWSITAGESIDEAKITALFFNGRYDIRVRWSPSPKIDRLGSLVGVARKGGVISLLFFYGSFQKV